MKKLQIMLVMLAATFSILNIQAGAAGLLKSIQGPGFELFNKAPQTITVALMINGKLIESRNIASGQKYLKTVDLKDAINIGIYHNPTANVSTEFFSGALTPKPDALYEFNAPGKTKYVTWNPAKAPNLYPQTGPWGGLTGKSDSGYPLGDNLQQSQIRKK